MLEELRVQQLAQTRLRRADGWVEQEALEPDDLFLVR